MAAKVGGVLLRIAIGVAFIALFMSVAWWWTGRGVHHMSKEEFSRWCEGRGGTVTWDKGLTTDCTVKRPETPGRPWIDVPVRE
jgi:hypothetical protein